VTDGPTSPADNSSSLLGRLVANRFLRFLMVGTFNSAIGYGIYALLVLLGVLPELGLLVATIIGVLVAFRTTGGLVFRSRDNSLLIRFIAVYAAVYLINAGLLRLLVMMGVAPLVAQALLLPLTVVLSFLAMRRFVFDTRERD
jgi:putative flippase GtrA